jgi:PsbP-like protein
MIKTRTVVTGIIGIVVIVFVGMTLRNHANSNTEPVTQDTDSKTYQDAQLGFSVTYPSSWSVETKTTGLTIFSLPSISVQQGKGDDSIVYRTSIEVSGDDSYATLADFQKSIDTPSDAAAIWNREDLGYEQISGRTFYKYSWVHQVKALSYTTVVNGKLASFELKIDPADDATETQLVYKEFQTFLSNLRFAGQ